MASLAMASSSCVVSSGSPASVTRCVPPGKSHEVACGVPWGILGASGRLGGLGEGPQAALTPDTGISAIVQSINDIYNIITGQGVLQIYVLQYLLRILTNFL